MKKRTKQKVKRFTPESYVRNLLVESGFPKSKKFIVKSKDGRLVVRFNQKESYEER